MSGTSGPSDCYYRCMGEGTQKLKREVLPPQKPHSGIGVIVVAATAMFFAVASSAFILRARMAQSYCTSHRHATPVIVEIEASPPPRTSGAHCGAPVETSVDGKQQFLFFEANCAASLQPTLIRNNDDDDDDDERSMTVPVQLVR